MKLFSATGSCSPSPHIVAHEAGLPGACLGASRREGRHESGRAADRNRVRCDIDGSHRRLIRFAAHAPAILSVIVLAGALAGCASPPPAVTAHGLPAQAAPAPNVGRPFEVVADESSLIVLVYRAGALAALGHNHVISCRCISGTLYLPGDPLKGSFDLRIAVARLTVDDPSLRAAERSADFPADVPQSARQGTRHNMLGAALLYAARYPQIRLRAVGLRPAPAGQPGDLIAQALIEVRGHIRPIAVPVHYELRRDRLVASGRFSLRQSAIGLTPFSAMGGALRVRDLMRVRFQLVAKR
jgi:hypothetical protein